MSHRVSYTSLRPVPGVPSQSKSPPEISTLVDYGNFYHPILPDSHPFPERSVGDLENYVEREGSDGK